MKQNLKVIIFSCLIGTILAGIFFVSIKEKAEAKTAPVAYAFQVGVFKSMDNAEKLRSKYSFAKVVKDEDLYRVFIGVTVTNKEILRTIFDSQNYNYYVKQINISVDLLNNLTKYDEILLKTSQDSRLDILEIMLEDLPNEL